MKGNKKVKFLYGTNIYQKKKRLGTNKKLELYIHRIENILN